MHPQFLIYFLFFFLKTCISLLILITRISSPKKSSKPTPHFCDNMMICPFHQQGKQEKISDLSPSLVYVVPLLPPSQGLQIVFSGQRCENIHRD